MNKKICIITNECRYSPKRIKKELRSLGFDIDNNIDVITASSLILIALTNILKLSHSEFKSSEEKDTYSSKYISRKKYKKMVNSFPQPITKFGIISEPELFSYLQNSITKQYINCDKCLVLTGNTRLEDLNNNNIDTSSINYIIPDVSYLAL